MGQTALPALASWTPFTASLTVNNGDVYKQQILSLGSVVPPAEARESTILLIYLKRFGTDLTDTYTTSKDHGTAAANLGVLSADVHYRFNKVASETELPTEG